MLVIYPIAIAQPGTHYKITNVSAMYSNNWNAYMEYGTLVQRIAETDSRKKWATFC